MFLPAFVRQRAKGIEDHGDVDRLLVSRHRWRQTIRQPRRPLQSPTSHADDNAPKAIRGAFAMAIASATRSICSTRITMSRPPIDALAPSRAHRHPDIGGRDVGASLMPSPTMIVGAPLDRDGPTLLAGSRSENTASRSGPPRSSLWRLRPLPVTMTTLETPAARSAWMARGASRRSRRRAGAPWCRRRLPRTP